MSKLTLMHAFKYEIVPINNFSVLDVFTWFNYMGLKWMEVMTMKNKHPHEGLDSLLSDH